MRATISSTNGDKLIAPRQATLQPLLDYDGSRTLDRHTIESGWSETSLMGLAALSSYYRLEKNLSQTHTILVLCGPGNNGGDGLALAWHLLSAAHLYSYRLLLLQTSPARSEASKFYETLLGKLSSTARSTDSTPDQGSIEISSSTPGGARLQRISTAKFLEGIEIQAESSRLTLHSGYPALGDLRANAAGLLVIEALLGSGQSRELTGEFARICEAIGRLQKSGAKVVSLDVPAGLLESEPFAETGAFVPCEIHCYGTAKLACKLAPELIGRTDQYVNPMGFTPGPASPFQEVKRAPERLGLFRRTENGHKYSNGNGWLMAGSPGMEGASILSARSFFASGGGILTGYSPSRLHLLELEPSVMWKDLPDQHLEVRDPPDANPGSEKKSEANYKVPAAITVGPGTSPDHARQALSFLNNAIRHGALIHEGSGTGARPPERAAYSSNILTGTTASDSRPLPEQESRPALILDAAATALIAEYPDLQGKRTILTPHPGEWHRMGGRKIRCVADLQESRKVAKRLSCYILYKDSVSILLDPFEDRCYLYSWVNPSLGVAGTGDCLTGLLMTALCRTHDVVSAANASMELLHTATESLNHPRSSLFPEAFAEVLR
jgi:NAD(P)H-hydrate repair Nnr-like enzyme with NAD(P)H-hydrate dehydratase domain/NAD(P)H-hydrate repair Nnr-like enzyme with NAD(P)H-hydrate epimerase domain